MENRRIARPVESVGFRSLGTAKQLLFGGTGVSPVNSLHLGETPKPLLVSVRKHKKSGPFRPLFDLTDNAEIGKW